MAKTKKKGRKGTNAVKAKQEKLASLVATAQYKNHLDERYREAAHESFAKAMVGILWYCHTEMGFGRLRTMRLFLDLQRWFVEYLVDPAKDTEEGSWEGLDFASISQALLEETGIWVDPATAKYQMDDEALALYHLLRDGQKEKKNNE